jgi:FAD/FMN-containing dehydrogenase
VTSGHDIAALKRLLGPIRTEDNPALVKQKSRDFYWYSPVLKRQLDHVTADIIVSPVSEAELLQTLAAAHQLGIPVTPRGTGTGNYGQAMPLAGGIVLDLSGFSRVTEIRPGRYVAEPGAIISKIDEATRAHSGQEVRLHPSTYHTASIGGFIAGGSGGIGSIKWGGLRDWGNIIRLKVATMEKTPRILELTGADLHKVSHAYGTNGVITEVEMPLGPAYKWVDVLIGFGSFREAAECAASIGLQDGLALKQLAAIAAPAPHECFLRHRKFLKPTHHLVAVMVADFAVDALLAFARQFRGGEVLMRSDALTEDEARGLPPVYELCWNHTTLRALRVDPAITYLQVLYPYPDTVGTAVRVHEHFGAEVSGHLEFVRFDGKVTAFGLPLVRFSTEERLEEIMRIHEQMGAPIFNPHRYTLEEGGMKQTDAAQLAFKREADPQGLLNPGKMVAWENPDFDFSSGKTFLFRSLAQMSQG